MKIETLVIAFSYLFICLFNDFKIRVIVTFIVALSYKLYFCKERIIYRCALVLLLLISLPLKIDYFSTGRIDMIKDNYYTVSNGLYKVIVYSNEDVNYGSKVTINSNIKKITTYNNFQITDFSSYCKGNNIIGYVDDITKIDKHGVQKSFDDEKPQRSNYSSMYSQKTMNISTSINVVGKVLDDAIMEVDKYLDNAYMAGLPQVTVIHGRGTGTLRRGLQQLFRKHAHVDSFEAGSFYEGGDGVTVVNLKQ